MASSSELATLSRNIHRLTALLRQANMEPARPRREMLDTLADDVRTNLEPAARELAVAMAHPPNIDGILVTWGDRLFYPGSRVVKVKLQPRLGADAASLPAAAIGKRIEATVVRHAPQVRVKVTGGRLSRRRVWPVGAAAKMTGA